MVLKKGELVLELHLLTSPLLYGCVEGQENLHLHLNVGVHLQAKLAVNFEWGSDISESSQDIICFNPPFMSDVTFKVSVEYISSSQHINENSREKNIDARVWTAAKTGNERKELKDFCNGCDIKVCNLYIFKQAHRVLDEWVDDISTLKMSTPSVISPA